MTVNIKLMKRDKNTPVPTRSNKDFSIFSNIILPFNVSVMSDINENRKKIKAFYPHREISRYFYGFKSPYFYRITSKS